MVVKNVRNFWNNNLHNYILFDKSFLKEPEVAIANGFQKAEKEFLAKFNDEDLTSKRFPLRRCNTDTEAPKKRSSGSCAVIALFVDEIWYIANVGDCRAIISHGNQGSLKFYLSY